MPVVLKLTLEELTTEDIIKIFRMFCAAYDLEINKKDEEFLKDKALYYLRRESLDYKMHIGAKFFGEIDNNTTMFYGYSKPNDLGDKLKDENFQKLVKEFFKK